MIDELGKPPSVTLLSVAPPTVAPPLKVESYHTHWSCLLGWELDCLAYEKEKIIIWKIDIKVAIWDNAEFSLFVPGIRENYPRLEIGDLIHMREVLPQQQQGSGLAFEGRVVRLRKREGFIRALLRVLLIDTYTILSPRYLMFDSQASHTNLLDSIYQVTGRPAHFHSRRSIAIGI